MTIRLPGPCVVVLVGPSGAGKSTWAAKQFAETEIVSSDRLRAVVGIDAQDQRAGTDAFELLDTIVDRRLGRGLMTVIDTLGLDPGRRRRWIDQAEAAGLACFAIAFDTEPKVCRDRNRRRTRPIPAKVLSDQIKSFGEIRDGLAAEGFSEVLAPEPVEVVVPSALDAPELGRDQQAEPRQLDFGLHLPAFAWPGGTKELANRLADIATAAEAAGFTSLWVMDHFRQIPQVGRPWDPMLESYTTLGFLAGLTRTIRLGTLVTGVTYRNIGHLAKAVATLDVLSGGRAWCGLGAAWFEAEHRAYGWDFPSAPERLDLLEDALELLPLMWGPGTPAYQGRVVTVPEALCYPRPIQDPIPLLVGGGGERRTLRLAAQHADACNVFGDTDTVRHKVEVLHDHCEEVDRDPREVAVTHLDTVVVAPDRTGLNSIVEKIRPDGADRHRFATSINAGTIEDQIGRYRALADAGVSTAIVALADLGSPEPIERFAAVIEAFSGDKQQPAA